MPTGGGAVTWLPFRLAQRALDRILGIPSADLTELDPAEEMEVPEPVRRARVGMAWQAEQRRNGVVVGYRLGFGGKSPELDHPYEYDEETDSWRCDCSGAVAHQEGKPRNLPGYGYIWTDGLVRDGKKDVKGDLGYEVPRHEVQPGDLLVQASIDVDRDGKRDVIGHVGRVTAVDRPFVSFTKSVTVIHMASSKPGGYREKRDGKIWERRGIVFRFRR